MDKFIEKNWYGYVLADVAPKGDLFLIPRPQKRRYAPVREKDELYDAHIPVPDTGGDMYPNADPSTTGTVAADTDQEMISEARAKCSCRHREGFNATTGSKHENMCPVQQAWLSRKQYRKHAQVIGNPLNVPPPFGPMDPNGGGGGAQQTTQDLEARSDEENPEYKWKMDIPAGSTRDSSKVQMVSLFQNPDNKKFLAKLPDGKRVFLGNDLITVLKYLKRLTNVGMSDYLQHMDDYGPWIK